MRVEMGLAVRSVIVAVCVAMASLGANASPPQHVFAGQFTPLYPTGSLAAVFDMFSEAELGVSLRALYVLGLAADGAGYTSPLGVQFKKLTVYRKKQKNS